MKLFNRPLIFVAFALVVAALPACRKNGSNSGGGTATAVGPANPAVATSTSGRDVPVSTSSSEFRRRARAPRSARSDELWERGQQGRSDLRLNCTRGNGGTVLQAASVTHYFIPPQTKVGDYHCRNGYGYFGQATMNGTCLHPCRTLAADPRFYRPGEIIYFPALVGLTCGTGKNKMIHDGFMVVTDNGNPDAINIEGRFGVFWGQCNNVQNGFCLDEGAVGIDFTLTYSSYCRAWRPQDPTFNSDIKLLMYNQVRREAIRSGDRGASDFDLDAFIGLGVDQNGFIFRRSSR